MLSILPGLDASPFLHPMFVHFPIALWMAALGFWMIAFLFRREQLWSAGRWLLNLGLLGAVLSVGSGLWAEDRMGHAAPGHELVDLHRNLMLAATAFAGLTAIAAQRWRDPGRLGRGVVIALMLTTVGLTALGADRGVLVSLQHAGHEHAAPSKMQDHGAHDHSQMAPGAAMGEEASEKNADPAGEELRSVAGAAAASAAQEHRKEQPHDHGEGAPKKHEHGNDAPKKQAPSRDSHEHAPSAHDAVMKAPVAAPKKSAPADRKHSHGASDGAGEKHDHGTSVDEDAESGGEQTIRVESSDGRASARKEPSDHEGHAHGDERTHRHGDFDEGIEDDDSDLEYGDGEDSTLDYGVE